MIKKSVNDKIDVDDAVYRMEELVSAVNEYSFAPASSSPDGILSDSRQNVKIEIVSWRDVRDIYSVFF